MRVVAKAAVQISPAQGTAWTVRRETRLSGNVRYSLYLRHSHGYIKMSAPAYLLALNM